MSKLEDAARAQLRPGENVRASWRGLSDGLNRKSRQPGDAIVSVAGSAVIVAWLQMGFRPKAIAERFERADLLGVSEDDFALPGLAGVIERKNATTAPGRVMGNSATRPTLTVSTRRGDISVFFKTKQRGELRQAWVAINEFIH